MSVTPSTIFTVMCYVILLIGFIAGLTAISVRGRELASTRIETIWKRIETSSTFITTFRDFLDQVAATLNNQPRVTRLQIIELTHSRVCDGCRCFMAPELNSRMTSVAHLHAEEHVQLFLIPKYEEERIVWLCQFQIMQGQETTDTLTIRYSRHEKRKGSKDLFERIDIHNREGILPCV